MGIDIIVTVFEWLIFIALLYYLSYIMYKVVWYTVKMLALKKTLKRLNSKEVKICLKQRIGAVLWSSKLDVCFVIDTPTEKMEVTLVSFISVKGRWNIEKTRNRYYVEARHYNKWFYKLQYNSNAPEEAFDYHREMRIQRKELVLDKPKCTNARQIVLIYPYPQLLTYASNKYEYLRSGDKIEDYEILNIEDLLDSILKDGENDSV